MNDIAAVARRVADAIPTAREVVLVRDRCGRAEVVDAVLDELHSRGIETVVERVSNDQLREIIGGTPPDALARWDTDRAADTARVQALVTLGGWPADLAGLPEASVAAWGSAVGRVEAVLEARHIPTVVVAVPTTAIAERLGMPLHDLDRIVFDAITVPPDALAAATAPLVHALQVADAFELVSSAGAARMRRGGRPLHVDDGVVDEHDIATGAVVSNLPAGSIYWTTREEAARGPVGLTDGTVLQFGDDGRVIDGEFAGERVSHVGIATNPLVTGDIGWTIVDEHRAGAVFLALGENRYMGGTNASAINVDVIPDAAHVRPVRHRLLYVTDLFYEARGRVYRDEDLFVVQRLQEWFDIAMCGPLQAAALLDGFDAVVVRNSGPVIRHPEAYATFCAEARRRGSVVYNPLVGRGDMAGKQYLVDLTRSGHPVVPTIDRLVDLHRLPDADRYVVKPKLGSDSIGMHVVDRAGIAAVHSGDDLIQPQLALQHEVSFYAIDHEVQYALVTADPSRRWDLVRHVPSDEELAFAGQFLAWNRIAHGIQRVDGCRTVSGELLLMELEDLNPYLSLEVLPARERERFVTRMAVSIAALIDRSRDGSAS